MRKYLYLGMVFTFAVVLIFHSADVYKRQIILYDIKWIRLVGQVVKTPPSHGGIRGSIPLRAILNERRYAFVLFMA